VVEPPRPEDLAEALAAAQADGKRVIVAGRGLRLDIGNPVAADRLILTTHLNRLIDYQPDDMTVTAEAGMTLAELQARLATHGQRLALDPAQPEATTLGGLVAANPDGPWRAAFGTVRDQLLGLSVAAPDGTMYKSGSRVVKSVAGYDLPKLFTGSFGTLGAITQVTLRVRPLPTATGAVLARWEKPDALEAAWQALRQAALEPAFFEVGADSAGAFLAMGFEGESEAVAWQQDTFERLAHAPCERPEASLRRELAEKAHARTSPLLLKVSLPPAEAIATLCDAVAGIGHDGTWTGHAGNGILYGSFPAAAAWEVPAGRALVDSLRLLAAERRGHLVVLRAPRAWKEGWDVWGPTRPDFPLMKAVKQAFDPRRMMAPGRFVGGL
jgi:glycolate oxidase FAD binding subunit